MSEVKYAYHFMINGLAEFFTLFMPFMAFVLVIIFVTFMGIYLERLRKKGEEDV